ncbi:N-acetyltransferase esco2 [Massospora cicadina]|nr:N-acetyltransferase esco2 [Massospora cicadina]
MGFDDLEEFEAAKRLLPRAAVTYQPRRRQPMDDFPQTLEAKRASGTFASEEVAVEGCGAQKPAVKKLGCFVLIPKRLKPQPPTAPTPTLKSEPPNPKSLSHQKKANEGGRKSEQWFLSLSRKDLSTKCPECSMSYSRGRVDDERIHALFHESVVNGISLKVVWDGIYGCSRLKYKSEVFVKRVEGSKAQLAPATHCKAFGSLRPYMSSPKPSLEGEVVVYHGGRLGTHDQRKMDEICSVVNQSLGSTEIEPSRLLNSKIYLFLSPKRKVIGCLVAEPIRRAYRALPDPNATEDADAWVTEATPPPPSLGRKVGSHLLSALCKSFVFGIDNLPPSKVAFSQPTSAGRAIALSFTRGPGILVYSEGDLAKTF